MVVSDKLRAQFASWLPLMEKFITSPEMDKIFAFLKSESSKGKVVLPESKNVFKSFELCPRDSVRTVIYMMDPYPTKSKDNVIIADGVPLSCKNTGKLQPSLEFWYMKLEQEYKGFDTDMDYRPDCSYLLREEGVLLLNSSLTVELQKSGSHQEIWMEFQKYFIEEILNKFFSGLPIVLCGAQSQRLEKYINPLIHHIHKTSHPASVAHSGGTFWNTDMFKWIDNILQANNGQKIRWIRNKGESTEPMPEWVTKSMYQKSQVNEDEVLSDLPWGKNNRK